MFGIFRSPTVAICLVGFGILFMVAGHRNGAKAAALNSHGKTATADITKLEWREKKRSHEDSGYTAHIRFTTEDGQEVRDEVGVPSELGRALRDKSAPTVMTIRYLPEDPHTLEDVNKDDSSDAQKFFGRYMLLGGIVLLVWRFFKR